MSYLLNNATDDMVKKIGNKINIEYKPDDMEISTMTITCRLNILFDIVNIGKYVPLDKNGIIEIIPPPPGKIRSLLSKNDAYKRKVKKRFYNQITLYVMIKKDRGINVKLFSNGSIQMTGCKSIENAVGVLDKIIMALSKQIAKINFGTKKMEDILFVSDRNQLLLNKIFKFNIAMINSNFSIGFNIDRAKLFNVINKNKSIDGIYDPIMHAGVNIRYHSDDGDVSIFIFESGSIVITGASNCRHIGEAYNFVNRFLLENYRDIVMTETLSSEAIFGYLNPILKNN